MGLVLGEAEGAGEHGHQHQAAAHPEQAARQPGQRAGQRGAGVVTAASPGRYGDEAATPAGVQYWTSRTTSAKRVALVGAPSTTAIRSRPRARTQVATQ